MQYKFEDYKESADYIKTKLGVFTPKVAMILGSGLGYLGDEVENAVAVDYADIPHFKASTAPGHKGRLVFGCLEGKAVAVMQGRMHHYEGYSYEETSYAVRVLRLLGCDTLIVTNAAGCVRTDWKAGDLMLISDHIKMFSESPLRGENIPEFGVRFPDASKLYTPRLRQMAKETAKKLGLKNLTAISGRAEDISATGGEYREKFDLVCARAVAALPILSELCLPLVKVGGRMIALKGAKAGEELSRAASHIPNIGGKVKDFIEYSITDGGEIDEYRAAIICDKVKATPDLFPRAYAKIIKSVQ